jgi:hypothetical protein
VYKTSTGLKVVIEYKKFKKQTNKTNERWGEREKNTLSSQIKL